MMPSTVEVYVVKTGWKSRVVFPSTVASRGDMLLVHNYTKELVSVRFDDTSLFEIRTPLPVDPGETIEVYVRPDQAKYGTFTYHVELGASEVRSDRDVLVVPGDEVEAHSSPEIIIRR